MRRSVATTVLCVTAAFVAAPFLAGCEDGPNQTYSPATGTLFNNGEPDASFDPPTSAYDAGYASVSRTAACTADIKRARWAKMLTENIVPPRNYAGVDMAGGDTWQGLTVEAAEQPPDSTTLEGGNCQGVAGGNTSCPSGLGNCGQIFWGDNGEVNFIYNLATHVVDQMDLTLGYTGQMKFTSRDGKNNYVLSVGLPPQKNGKTYLIPWNNSNCKADPTAPCYDEIITELFNAAMATFDGKGEAGIPWPVDSPSCAKDHNCLQYPNDGAGNTILGFRPLVVYFLGGQHAGTPQPVNSTPTQLYNFYTKLEPYSKAPETLKIDSVGPTASVAVGDGMPPKTCTIQIGQTYQNFLDNCINVWSSANSTLNTLDLNKVLGGRSHDYENIQFNVVGVNQNFSLTPDLSTYQIVQDTDLPKATDFSTDWYFDVRASASLANETAGANGLLGTGLVQREFVRLAQQDINQYLPVAQRHAIGDPKCVTQVPAAAGCTGLESIYVADGDPNGTPPGAAFADDPPGLQIEYTTGTPWGSNGCNVSVIEPGDPQACYADAAHGPAKGPFWDQALQQVTKVLGNGDILSLPPAVRDRRYFFRWFGIADVKYLKAYGAAMTAGTDPTKITPTIVANTTIDLESLFFDNSFANQFDKIEYIDRSVVVNPPPAGQEYLGVPMDYEYGTDVKAGNQRYTNWYRRLDREENALFKAYLRDPSKLPGQENSLNLTNMFGSPVLANAYPSLKCATEIWTAGKPSVAAAPDYATGGDCAGAAPPPLDANGNTVMDLNGQMALADPAHAAAYANPQPLLAQYPGVWGQTILTIGHSPIQINATDRLVEGAHANIPVFANVNAACAVKGYPTNVDPNCDPAMATAQNVLVPWQPDQPGSGFFIPNGADVTTVKLIQAGTLDFTGVLETYEVFYKPYVDQVQPQCASDTPCLAGYTCQSDNPSASTGTLSGQCIASDNSIKVAAIFASDFLGEIFVCQDPNSGDILHVRQYQSTFDILTWLADHPGNPANQVPSAQDACNIGVKYSAFDNYPDYIVSSGNGIVLNTNQGQGYGRIVDAELFDVNYLSQ
jgi:hypothetical protein